MMPPEVGEELKTLSRTHLQQVPQCFTNANSRLSFMMPPSFPMTSRPFLSASVADMAVALPAQRPRPIDHSVLHKCELKVDSELQDAPVLSHDLAPLPVQ
eukprot:CAMPEP_0206269514 /NCGR_PEP_ID=MMETSP0047_2-20121206/32331_1 /ASSEMBLY_ACC=CAM_ASM_000192 /TAXON_ID=195065 /ORGANISM="Chroomonas mesostigmatica_cf, Strain CCMP1168" /LENGTH=99 /DNA_ID=CAMNT_0053698005 /DNA_START=37 /DNA_END=338 /DNA_ORIENTATION=+